MAKTRKALYRFYRQMQEVVAPGLDNSQCNYRDILQAYVKEHSRWLDLCCGQQILPQWMPSSDEEQCELVERSEVVVGIDYEPLALRRQTQIKYLTVGNIQNLPFRAGSFSLVTANMVVEHLESPDKALAEVHRVLAPKGLFIFHTPNLLNYATLLTFVVPKRWRKRTIQFLDGRKEEDIFPVYYRMNSPRTIRSLACAHGFHILELNAVESSAETVMLGPIVLIELLVIRMFRFKLFANLRSNLITVLQKTDFQDNKT